MKDILEAFDFLLDIVCMMPPLDKTDMAGVPAGVLMAACLGCVFLLVVSVTASGMKDAFGGKGILGAAAALCIGLIGFISMERSALQSIFVVAYPAMVISLRGAEGLILGSKYQPIARFWHLLAFLGAGVGLYVALCQFPTPIKPRPVKTKTLP